MDLLHQYQHLLSSNRYWSLKECAKLLTTLPAVHICHHYLLIKCVQKWKNSSRCLCDCTKHAVIRCWGRRWSDPFWKQSNELDAIGVLVGGSIMHRFLLPENVYTPPSGQRVNYFKLWHIWLPVGQHALHTITVWLIARTMVLFIKTTGLMGQKWPAVQFYAWQPTAIGPKHTAGDFISGLPHNSYS